MGSKPVGLPEELELEQLQLMGLAVAEKLQELQPELHRSHQLHNLQCSSCRSSRLQLRNHTLPELLQPDVELNDRSQQEHMSEQILRKGCSSSDSCGAGRRFRQQPLHELVRLSHSEHRRKRS